MFSIYLPPKQSLPAAPFHTLIESFRERAVLEMCNSKLQDEKCKSQHL